MLRPNFLILKGMSSYLVKNPSGKKFHDPLAASVALNRDICEFAEVKFYHTGLFGSYGNKYLNRQERMGLCKRERHQYICCHFCKSNSLFWNIGRIKVINKIVPRSFVQLTQSRFLFWKWKTILLQDLYWNTCTIFLLVEFILISILLGFIFTRRFYLWNAKNFWNLKQSNYWALNTPMFSANFFNLSIQTRFLKTLL